MKIVAYPAFKNKAYNPYNYLLYSNLQALGDRVYEFSPKSVFKHKFDILHIHWPPELNSNWPILRFFYNLAIQILIYIAKLRGAKVVWTVHNIKPHDKKTTWVDKFKMTLFIRSLDGYIVMNRVTEAQLFSAYPKIKGKKFAFIRHGTYEGYYPNEIAREDARIHLDISPDSKVVLFFGLIKKYKGIQELLKVFTELPPEYVLLIAGDILKSEADSLNILFSIQKPEIRFHIRRIEDYEVQFFFNSADLVVFPYRSILNSGAMLLALGFGVPILATKSETTTELMDELGADFVNLYDDCLTEETIKSVLDRQSRSRKINMSERSWGKIATSTHEFYDSVLSSVR